MKQTATLVYRKDLEVHIVVNDKHMTTKKPLTILDACCKRSAYFISITKIEDEALGCYEWGHSIDSKGNRTELTAIDLNIVDRWIRVLERESKQSVIQAM